jgi:hypothetical protein
LMHRTEKNESDQPRYVMSLNFLQAWYYPSGSDGIKISTRESDIY